MSYIIILNVWLIMIVSLLAIQVGNQLAEWLSAWRKRELSRWEEIVIAVTGGALSYLIVLGAAMALYTIMPVELALLTMSAVTVAGTLFIESIRDQAKKIYTTSVDWLNSIFTRDADIAQA